MNGDAFANFESVSRLAAASFLVVGAGRIAEEGGKKKNKKVDTSTSERVIRLRGGRSRRGEERKKKRKKERREKSDEFASRCPPRTRERANERREEAEERKSRGGRESRKMRESPSHVVSWSSQRDKSLVGRCVAVVATREEEEEREERKKERKREREKETKRGGKESVGAHSESPGRERTPVCPLTLKKLKSRFSEGTIVVCRSSRRSP